MDKYLLDTSAILYNYKIFEMIADGTIIILPEVLKELDHHKNDYGSVGFNARAFSRFLESKFMNGVAPDSIKVNENLSISIHKSKILRNTADDAILAYPHDDKDNKIYVITDDVYLSIMSRLKGFSVVSCIELFNYGKVYTGVTEIYVTQKQLDEIHENKELKIRNETFYPNQYVLLKHNKSGSACAKYLAKKGTLKLIRNSNKLLADIRPKNVHQKFLVDAILDNNIKIVMSHSPAGCGKTIISLSAALYMVRIKQQYQELIISKSVMPVGQDKLGFMPGTFDDKMKYWLFNYSDNLALMDQQDLFECADISICSSMHLRGRSINNSIIIIDEFQNFTPAEAKTIITRVGNNSKIICLGDISQIDNPVLNAYNNGLTFIINRMKGYDISAVIALEDNERSDVSKLAADVL